MKCRKNTKSKNPWVARTKNGKVLLLWKWTMCDSKKLKFIKEQKSSGLLCSLEIKTPFNKILLVGPLFFKNTKWMK